MSLRNFGIVSYEWDKATIESKNKIWLRFTSSDQSNQTICSDTQPLLQANKSRADPSSCSSGLQYSSRSQAPEIFGLAPAGEFVVWSVRDQGQHNLAASCNNEWAAIRRYRGHLNRSV